MVTWPKVVVPDELADAPDGASFVTEEKAFCEVFSKPPQERGLSLDGVSYEELQSLYHAGPR